MTRVLTIGFSVYGQPAMLDMWFERFTGEPQQWRDLVEVIVVDDCGKPAAKVPSDPGIKLYRVREDIPWNQGGARNLISSVAETKRLMLIDPDMTLPKGMLQNLVKESLHLEPGMVFRPALRHVGNEKLDHTSPNVHLMLREDFERIRGYDEDYCGHKGWSDVQLLRVMQTLYTLRHREDLWFWFHHQDTHIPDAQVMKLDRSTKHNKALHIRKLGLLKRLGWRKFIIKAMGARLRFTWERVQ